MAKMPELYVTVHTEFRTRPRWQDVVALAWLGLLYSALVLLAGYLLGVRAQAQCPTRITGGGALVEQRINDTGHHVACKWTLLN